jgi:hypothetical protein
MHERERQTRFNNRLTATALAALALGAGYVAFGTGNGPSCEGQQLVVAGDSSNKTLDGIKHQYIDVPAGRYVDLDRVEADILRSPTSPSYPVKGSTIEPGDTVVIPQTCE